jgi:colanic acid biosynthesis protein WcaH
VNRGKHWLEPDIFAQVVRRTPLVSIDLILRDPDGAGLVGRRAFEPAKGLWFVPGGRIGKMEALDEAFARILKAETGLGFSRDRAELLGVYEHFYDTNRFEDPEYGTHYVVLGYQLRLASRPQIRLDDQHAEIRWMARDNLLADPHVHLHTKAYFT